MSKLTPGLKVAVPAAAKSVWEHPTADALIVETPSGKFFAYKGGQIKYEAKKPSPPWSRMQVGNETKPAGAWAPGASAPKPVKDIITGEFGHIEVKTSGKPWKPSGSKVTSAGTQEDPYWASQAAAAGLNPNAKKLPPGPVVPKASQRKLFETVHSENQRIAAEDQRKHGPRSTRARLGLPSAAPQSRPYRPRKPKAPAAKG
jgi:hypothetical protein